MIRDATEADKAGFLALWDQYLAFYDVTLSPDITTLTWARLMDPANALNARLAFDAGEMAGFAIHLNHPSTWVAGDDCYLEDLFLSPAARGKGLGRALIDDLIALARSRGWHRLYWNTDLGNAQARRLYDRYTAHDNHIRYRMDL